jgi:hypothetical protein
LRAAGKEKSDCERSKQQDESHSGIFRTTSTKFTKNISTAVCEIDGMQADWVHIALENGKGGFVDKTRIKFASK